VARQTKRVFADNRRSGDPQPGGGRSPHAAAACLNAGDCKLSPGAAGMNLRPVLGNVGSGKFGTPCLRMHLRLGERRDALGLRER
jgi:hypothetical protein